MDQLDALSSLSSSQSAKVGTLFSVKSAKQNVVGTLIDGEILTGNES
jgi:hypothetical protein